MKPFLFALVSPFLFLVLTAQGQERPNILFCISDDQSYAHTGANGDPVILEALSDKDSINKFAALPHDT